MEFRKVSTRFMDANKDVNAVVLNVLIDYYGMSAVFNSEFDWEECLYSNGFVHAIQQGLVPVLGTESESFKPKRDGEYHHFISNDECYVVYFKEI